MFQYSIILLSSIVFFGNGFTHRSIIKTTPIKSNIILKASPRRIDVGEGQNINFAKDLMKHDLLTGEDEFMLARQFKLGVQIVTQKDRMEYEFGRAVTDAELAQVFEIPTHRIVEIINNGDAAKRTLVKGNMRLVFHIAKYYRFRGVAYPDLVQEGIFGLIKAIEKYDPDRGFRFSTYASWWIKQAVGRAIAEKSRIVRLPVHIHDMVVSVSRAERQFAASHSRKPTTAELAERLALPIQKVELLQKCSRDVTSMDEDAYQQKAGAKTSNEMQVKDKLVSEITPPIEINERKTLRHELRRVMGVLSQREAQIIEMRFGLSESNPMTLEEIGKAFGVTRERIRQIEARALSKLRNPLKASEFKDIFQEQSDIVIESMFSSQTSIPNPTVYDNVYG